MGRYHAILFDMDGTLLDTLTDMQDAVNHVLAAHGLPLRTLEEVRRFVGNGAGPLIHRALPEGDLTRIRAALVCEESLHEVAQSLDLGSYLKLGKGEEAGGGRQRASILADATESIFAAVYLDGGLEAARALIHRVLLDKERETDVEERRRDYKTELQELVQRRSNQTLQYELVSASGPDHAKVFTSRVLLNGQPIGKGQGHSKKEAEQAAAHAGLTTLIRG